MENLVNLGTWIPGAIVVIGLIQWIKGIASGAPTWVWAAIAPIIAIVYSYSPPAIRDAAGFLAVSQLGYETIIQMIKRKLGGGSA